MGEGEKAGTKKQRPFTALQKNLNFIPTCLKDPQQETARREKQRLTRGGGGRQENRVVVTQRDDQDKGKKQEEKRGQQCPSVSKVKKDGLQVVMDLTLRGSLVAVAHFDGRGGLWPRQVYFLMKLGWEEESQHEGQGTWLCAWKKDKLES